MSRCRRAGGAGDAFQLVVVLFPGGGTGFWRHAADALTQPGSTVDGFPDDVRLPGAPREVLDRVCEQGVQRRVPAVFWPPRHGSTRIKWQLLDRGVGVRPHPPVEVRYLLARLGLGGI